MSGWTGVSQAIRASFTNSATGDRMDFTTTAGTRLNLVLSASDLNLGGDFVTGSKVFNATLVQSGAQIIITLTGPIGGNSGLTTAAPGTMTWKPSTAATDLAGNPALSTQVTESGTTDRDF
jgi:hypothetical protein